MANGSLEDAPVIPRTYRILSSMPAWKVVAVVAATSDVLTRESDRVEKIPMPFGATRLSTTAFEIGIPALEKWENVVRVRKDLNATEARPMYVFITLSNGTIMRMYPSASIGLKNNVSCAGGGQVASAKVGRKTISARSANNCGLL